MSIHDETWDKCPKCKQVIKTWHGNYHEDGGCLVFPSHGEYIEAKEIRGSWIPKNQEKFGQTLFSIEASRIPEIVLALESGLEYAQECLIRHDQNLGRTIPRNKHEAEYMEEDIEKIKEAIQLLK